MHRPLNADGQAVAYERPAFAPTPEQDPDMLLSAARYAARAGYTRAQQETYAVQSHRRAITHQAHIAPEIVPILGIAHDVVGPEMHQVIRLGLCAGHAGQRPQPL